MTKHPDGYEVVIDPDVYDFYEGRASDLGLTVNQLLVRSLEDHARSLGYQGERRHKYRKGTIPDRIVKALEHGERKTITDLADELGTTPPAIRSAMHRMKQAGVIKSDKVDHLRANGAGRPPMLWELV